MTKGSIRLAVLLGTIIASFGIARANDLTGALSIGGVVGPAFPFGGESVKAAGQVGPGVGGTLRYGVTKNISAMFAYDYLAIALQSEALTWGGIYHFTPDRALSPFVDAGLGLGKRFSGDSRNKFVFKVGIGIERYLTTDMSISPMLHYFFINGDSNGFGHEHVFEPALWVNYHIGAK